MASRRAAARANTSKWSSTHTCAAWMGPVDGAPEQSLVRAGDSKPSSARTRQIESPEGRDQRDYVRRIVKEISDPATAHSFETEVKAVGMIGRDVHDKLVLAQALRAAFPDRVLFTTDLDARLLHPDVTGYTRNIIVASSLPLSLRKDLGRHSAVPRLLPDGDVPRGALCRCGRRQARREAWRDQGRTGKTQVVRDRPARQGRARYQGFTQARGRTARDLRRAGGGRAAGPGWPGHLHALRAGHVDGPALAVRGTSLQKPTSTPRARSSRGSRRWHSASRWAS